MSPGYAAFLRALVRTALEEWEGLDPRARRRAEDFVLGQHGRLPDHLRAPMWVLGLLFAARAFAGSGRRFAAQGAELRRRRLRAWRSSGLAPLRDFARFHEALAAFAALERAGGGEGP